MEAHERVVVGALRGLRRLGIGASQPCRVLRRSLRCPVDRGAAQRHYGASVVLDGFTRAQHGDGGAVRADHAGFGPRDAAFGERFVVPLGDGEVVGVHHCEGLAQAGGNVVHPRDPAHLPGPAHHARPQVDLPRPEPADALRLFQLVGQVGLGTQVLLLRQQGGDLPLLRHVLDGDRDADDGSGRISQRESVDHHLDLVARGGQVEIGVVVDLTGVEHVLQTNLDRDDVIGRVDLGDRLAEQVVHRHAVQGGEVVVDVQVAQRVVEHREAQRCVVEHRTEQSHEKPKSALVIRTKRDVVLAGAIVGDGGVHLRSQPHQIVPRANRAWRVSRHGRTVSAATRGPRVPRTR